MFNIGIMRKYIHIALLSVLVALTSCDLNEKSADSIPYSEAFKSIETIESLERGAYSRLRTQYSLSSIIAPDIQADYVNAVNGFSNTYGSIYQWTFAYNDQDVTSTWNTMYGTISQCNFILDGIAKNLAFTPTEKERLTLEQIQGRLYLIRAMSYSLLAERFCQDYEAETAGDSYTGLPLALTHDTSLKLDRSTLQKTYETILDDLSKARTLLAGSGSGSPNSTTLNLDCVTAVEAHVYLQMDDWPNALAKAKTLINNTAYSLVESKEELREMWEYDTSDEIIFKFYASTTEIAYQWGYYFFFDYFSGTGKFFQIYPDYIPTQTCVDAFEDEDWRKSVYLTDCSMNGDFTFKSDYALFIKGLSMYARNAYVISKYPGNPDLRTSNQSNYYNTFKPIRLAEMYLIAAEAAVQSDATGEDAASNWLNPLREHRGLAALETVTLADVQEERYREMMLEGTRLTDLKRWKLPMDRGECQSGYVGPDDYGAWTNGSYVSDLGTDLVKESGDYMFVWPIPADEIFASPQFAAQQNPGWSR